MKKQPLPEGFSPFTWALAVFCFPILLWPLSLLLSTAVLENQNLTESHRTFASFSMWLYPFVLAFVARQLFKLNQRNPSQAKVALVLSAVSFWGVFFYIVLTSF